MHRRSNRGFSIGANARLNTNSHPMRNWQYELPKTAQGEIASGMRSNCIHPHADQHRFELCGRSCILIGKLSRRSARARCCSFEFHLVGARVREIKLQSH